MPFVGLDEVHLHYETQGKGEALLLLTGLGGDLRFWKKWMPLLGQDFQVITLDNRGSGRTEYPKRPFTMEDMARDAVGLLDHLGVQKAHVAGWSMGGNIAQAVALNFPERVRTLTLMSTYTRRPERSSVAIDTIIRTVREGASIQTLQTMMQCWCMPEKAFGNGTNGNGRGNGKSSEFIDGFELQKRALDGFDSSGTISSLRMPCLIMHGNADIMVPMHYGTRMRDLIEGATFVEIDGDGHILSHQACFGHMIGFLGDRKNSGHTNLY